MLTKFERARCGPAGGRKRDRRLPRNTNATARHRVILMPRFSDTIQLIPILLRQPTSTLSDEAPTGFTGQRGVCFVNGIFAPKLRIRLSSSGALLILYTVLFVPVVVTGYLFASGRRHYKRTLDERIRHTPPSPQVSSTFKFRH
jgi:hypothetical protein